MAGYEGSELGIGLISRTIGHFVQTEQVLMTTGGPITFYGANWCGDSRRSRQFLDGHGVAYNFVDVEADQEATELVLELNGGMRSIPTIVFPDGEVLVEPSDAQLRAKLGI